jgi:hypothetical protein
MRLTFSDFRAGASGHAMAPPLASVMTPRAASYAPLSRGSHSTTPAALRITANLAAKCLSWAKGESAFLGPMSVSASCGIADRLGVNRVVLVALDVSLHVFRGIKRTS